jgi:hypothetical protein
VGGDMTAALWFLMFGVLGFVLPQVIARAIRIHKERRRLQRRWDANTRRIREDCAQRKVRDAEGRVLSNAEVREQQARLVDEARRTMFGRDT